MQTCLGASRDRWRSICCSSRSICSWRWISKVAPIGPSAGGEEASKRPSVASQARANQAGMSHFWIPRKFHRYKSPALCNFYGIISSNHHDLNLSFARVGFIITMLQRADRAVGPEVLHTWRPTKYVRVFPVMGMPRMWVLVTRGISQKYGTKRGKIKLYLHQGKASLPSIGVRD